MADTNGWNWIDLANLALAGYQTYNNTRDPKFKDPGLTPEQRQLYDLFFKSLTNPTLANNAGDVSNYGRSILGGYSNLGWQSPKTHSGDVGYAGHAPVNFDWSKLPGGGGGAIPTSPAPGGLAGPGTSPSPIPGDPFGHLGSPAGSQGDPFAGLPSGSSSQSDGVPSGIATFLDSHPNLLQNGAAAAATALASILGVPPMIASGLVGMYMKSRGGSTPDLTNGKMPDVIRGHAYDSQGVDPLTGQPIIGHVPNPQQYDMRPPSPVTYTNRDPGGMYDPGHGISGGIVQPEGQGMGQGGFGNGWGYDQFYGGTGGAGPDFNTKRMIRQSPYRGLLAVGQRV